ncbi:hypothetical protein CY0110_15957 [Crocosphaera chwakensis CCY0110]|uniref:Uncharacterized protein n=1 Tax=Crocosphaera chwakensis CCY0110 TaxID=391612 RepID=A3IHM3_9CHRO|nr:hypothetical protein CY0110_15957 [Crocosphaera chwakensis CCY0110]
MGLCSFPNPRILLSALSQKHRSSLS